MGYWEQIGADNRRRERELLGAPWWRRIEWGSWLVLAVSAGLFGLMAYSIVVTMTR